MSKHLLVTAMVAAGVVIAAPAAAPGRLDPGAPAAPRREAANAYGKLPLAFVPNVGQTDPHVRFSAQTARASFFFTRREAVVSLRHERKSDVIRLRFVGARANTAVAGHGRQAGKVNYLIGNDRAKWHTDVPTYREIVYRELWPGIDLAFRGNGRTLKYEFRVAAGADPSAIQLAYRGARDLSVDGDGRLVIRMRDGVLRDARPISYQEVGGRRSPVASRFALEDGGYGFAIGRYDRTRPLVVDPGLIYSTYLGGTDLEYGNGIAVDAAGSAYVTGYTTSTDFPTTAGAFDTGLDGGTAFDAFVTKLNASGTDLVYSTYLGGSGVERAFGIAVDAAGSAYVTGETSSTDLPTTAGAFDTSLGSDDAFVTKLNPSGTDLVYSTYLGGSSLEQGLAIAVDAAGSAYVTGDTTSTDFPTTAGAFDTSLGSDDAFVTKLNASGTGLAYSTYLGGSGLDRAFGIAVDAAGTAYVTGETSSADFPTALGAFDAGFSGGNWDAFVTKLNPSGTGLVYSTYLGGSDIDQAFGIAVDAAGSAYVTGYTSSTDFPTTAGAYDASGSVDAFVSKLNASGSGLVYSTYLGGSSFEQGLAIAVDAAGSAYVTGETGSTDFPTTPGAFDAVFGGGFSFDAFVTKVNASGSGLVYSTYLGGSGYEQGGAIAVDTAGSAYVAGRTTSTDFPTTLGAFDTVFSGSSADAFVAKLDMSVVPATLTLSPPADTNPVGTSHTVTATVQDGAGQVMPNVTVRFSVSGSVTASGQCTTGANGQCSFTYQGPQLPGADLITAFADSDGDGVWDQCLVALGCAGEPIATATKAWVLPTSTAGQASGGGQFETAAADISFGFFAKNAGGLKGSCNVVEHGGRMIKCLDVTALVLSGNLTTLYGNASDDGAATTYVIHAVDNADPGKGADTFSIQTASAYSAAGTLTAGNVQVQP